MLRAIVIDASSLSGLLKIYSIIFCVLASKAGNLAWLFSKYPLDF
jgi:hypothetical protein